MDMNKVCLTGKIVVDMKQSKTPNCQVGVFCIVVHGCTWKNQKQEDTVSVFNCILYRQMVEATSSFMKKGRKVGLVGHLKQELWDRDGQIKSHTVIIVEQVFPLSVAQ